MSVRDLIVRNRSYRRFVEDEPVSLDTLRELVDLARLTPSAANRQPLRYILSADPKTNAQIFPTLSWAGYLKDWPGPEEGERPAAYIVILNDTDRQQNGWLRPRHRGANYPAGRSGEGPGRVHVGLG